MAATNNHPKPGNQSKDGNNKHYSQPTSSQTDNKSLDQLHFHLFLLDADPDPRPPPFFSAGSELRFPLADDPFLALEFSEPFKFSCTSMPKSIQRKNIRGYQRQQ